jgi:thymidylate synthase
MKRFPNFRSAIDQAHRDLKTTGYEVPATYWQGVDVSSKPELKSFEMYDFDFRVAIYTEDLDVWRADIQPNLPWADRHFEEERVSGQPINPGETWKVWPYGHSADRFRDAGGQYNHTYAERYWPRRANPDSLEEAIGEREHKGIRYRYGDLNDLLAQFVHDPLTRQGYLPVWFPEDGSHQDRKPCSLGYHFIMRSGFFHCKYYIRSCDIIRHFRDDIYLTLRLQLWILDKLTSADSHWAKVKPGYFTMYISSLHCFANDYPTL